MKRLLSAFAFLVLLSLPVWAASTEPEPVMLSADQCECFDRCVELHDQALRQTRGILGHIDTVTFDADIAARERDVLVQQIEGMLEEHDRMIEGFDEAALKRLEKRLAKLDEIRSLIKVQLINLDLEIERQEIDEELFAMDARRLERSLEAWQKQYERLDKLVMREEEVAS